MYSFEGDYRRKPQQNLAGASRTDEKSVLLQHAQFKRSRREDARQRHNAAVKIQAQVRSFLIRKFLRAKAREEFDRAQQQTGGKNLSLDDLATYVRSLLFFYDRTTDSSRLVWMLQHFLKHQQEIKIKSVKCPYWLWRLRWILRRCMGQKGSRSMADGECSLAIPLRALEAFTSREESEKVLQADAYRYLESIFVYLIRHNYFGELRALIDAKVPPMLEVTPTAPTVISKCLLDMIRRPLDLIGVVGYLENEEEFSTLVLQELCECILSPTLSDPVRMFVIPALSVSVNFPYGRLIECIDKSNMKPTINLLYSILSLESDRSVLTKFGLISPATYLRVLARFSSTIVPLPTDQGDEDSDDSDTESSVNMDQEQADIQRQCIDMLNEERRVYGILLAVDRCTDSDTTILQPLCELCHHLLITDKSAVHKYKLLYMLAFKPIFLKKLWYELLSVQQVSLFGGRTALLQIISRGIALSPEDTRKIVPLLAVFCSLFSLLIATLHDSEFFVDGQEPMGETEEFGAHSTSSRMRMSEAKTTSRSTMNASASTTGSSSMAMTATAMDSSSMDASPAASTVTTTTEENDQCQQAMPFTIHELVLLSSQLKGICLGIVELAFPDSRPTVRDDYKNAVLGGAGNASISSVTQNDGQEGYFSGSQVIASSNSSGDSGSAIVDIERNTQMWTHLFKVTVALLQQLHTRDLRRQFCPENHWIGPNMMIPVDKQQDFTSQRHRLRGYVRFQGLRVFTREELEEGPPLSVNGVRTLTLLREIPFVVPFNERVVVFQTLINHDKMKRQGHLTHFLQGSSIQISVRRNYLYEDAFEKLSPENEPELRLKTRVHLVNAAGLEEAGVDGGGLFREFLSELLKTSFDPNRGFFRLTKDNMLYPNPSVQLLVDDFSKHYYFIGRILGKALYENLLVELPFAEFFLSKIVGRHSDVDVHHLASLDPIMYRNLLYLKSYKGDVADLGLDFTVLTDDLGERRVEELKANGANIAVTNHNRIEYIHLMADYKLNKQIRAQCYAFKQGIVSVIPLNYLQMFNNKELQVLISGAQIPVDVNDLKLHTNYTGGYAPDHPTILAFWKVVNEFNDQQKSQLLKFVTSCSRPPLLGFKELDPPFCIQHAGSVDRLPTSSTCMNLLKLPEFPDEKTLREKLLYAIQSGAGFELS